MSKLIAQKTCNALLKNVSPNAFMDEISDVSTIIIIKGFKKAMGGLWVGGNAFLYEDRIEFRPNSLNKSIHKGETSWTIPLKYIDKAFVSWGLLTKIINIETKEGTLKIRCFGAQDLCNKIESTKLATIEK